jgi:hypothetical protein
MGGFFKEQIVFYNHWKYFRWILSRIIKIAIWIWIRFEINILGFKKRKIISFIRWVLKFFIFNFKDLKRWVKINSR